MAIDEVFDRTQICSAYQPIVDMHTGDVVAVEALARWPQLPVTPDIAFEYARQKDRVDELNVLCQRAAIEGLRASSLPAGFKVFINVEPGRSVATLLEGTQGSQVVAEITERALLDDPAELLHSIREMRSQGFGIALDDVGAVPDSLALLPFVAPDIIKLDLSLVQQRPNADQARILTAVAAYTERSGAIVLAEGIESDVHYRQALSLGATLGQGWYFSQPGDIARYPEPRVPIDIPDRTEKECRNPFELLDPRRLRIGTKGTLLSISRHIEQQGMTLDIPPVVISAFQTASNFTPDTILRYVRLANRCPLVVALGAGIPHDPAPGVRGARLEPGDGLLGEWTVAIVGTHYNGALIAKDLGDKGPDHDRRFAFALSHDHVTVHAAARILLSRVEPRRS